MQCLQTVGTCCGVDGGRSTRAVAPSGDVGTHHKELVGVHSTTRSNKLLPPASAGVVLQQTHTHTHTHTHKIIIQMYTKTYILVKVKLNVKINILVCAAVMAISISM